MHMQLRHFMSIACKWAEVILLDDQVVCMLCMLPSVPA